MATHDFESLGSVLQRLGVAVPPPGEHLPAEPDPDPSCLKCRDVGWVSQDGRAVECPCGIVTTRRMARIWASSQVPETMRGYTLDSYLERTGERPARREHPRRLGRPDRWLLFVGPVGLGKTGLALALLLEHIRSGAAGLYVVTPSYLSRIRATYTRVKDGEVDEMDVLASVIEAPLLVLDDLGKTALSRVGPGEAVHAGQRAVPERAPHDRDEQPGHARRRDGLQGRLPLPGGAPLAGDLGPDPGHVRGLSPDGESLR
jgi:hypothetical protein